MGVLVGFPLVQLGDELGTVQEHLVLGSAVAGHHAEHVLEPPRCSCDILDDDHRLRANHAAMLGRSPGA